MFHATGMIGTSESHAESIYGTLKRFAKSFSTRRAVESVILRSAGVSGCGGGGRGLDAFSCGTSNGRGNGNSDCCIEGIDTLFNPYGTGKGCGAPPGGGGGGGRGPDACSCNASRGRSTGNCLEKYQSVVLVLESAV